MCSLLLWANYVPTGFWGNYIKAIINLFLQRTDCTVRATDIKFVCHTIFKFSNSRLLQPLRFALFLSMFVRFCQGLNWVQLADFKVKVHERCWIKSIQKHRTIAPLFHFLFHLSVCLSVSNSWIKNKRERCMCENKKICYHSATPNLTPMHKGYIC